MIPAPTYHFIRALDERQFAVLSSTGERVGIYPSHAWAQRIVEHADATVLVEWKKTMRAARKAASRAGGAA